ncbi:hypothetical protein AB0I84_49910, partial [Streptomyces spectabilis]
MTTTGTTGTTGTPDTGGRTAPERPRGLRDFYEDPGVPVASGDARSLRQARHARRGGRLRRDGPRAD